MGLRLAKKLLTNNSKVDLTIIDNLSSTKQDYSQYENECSIQVEDFLHSKYPEMGFDEIYHLASPVGSLGILKNSGLIAKNIIDLALKAAEWAKRSNSKLLYVSSSEVYGKDGIREESDSCNVPVKFGPRMEYALGKLSAEHLLMNLSMKGNYTMNIVRPFNVIGENQSPEIGFVVPRFFESCRSGKEMEVHGTGEQRRAFCYVDDLVSGLISVMNSKASWEIFNLGNPNSEINISQLAEKINQLMGSPSLMKKIDPRLKYGSSYLEAFDKIPSIGKARLILDWEPKVSLDEALKRIKSSYQQKSEQINGKEFRTIAA